MTTDATNADRLHRVVIEMTARLNRSPMDMEVPDRQALVRWRDVLAAGVATGRLPATSSKPAPWCAGSSSVHRVGEDLRCRTCFPADIQSHLTPREQFDLAMANCAVARANFRLAAQAMQDTQDELAAAGEALAAEARRRLAELNERPRGTALIPALARNLGISESRLRAAMYDAGVDQNSHPATAEFAREYVRERGTDAKPCQLPDCGCTGDEHRARLAEHVEGVNHSIAGTVAAYTPPL